MVIHVCRVERAMRRVEMGNQSKSFGWWKDGLIMVEVNTFTVINVIRYWIRVVAWWWVRDVRWDGELMGESWWGSEWGGGEFGQKWSDPFVWIEFVINFGVVSRSCWELDRLVDSRDGNEPFGSCSRGKGCSNNVFWWVESCCLWDMVGQQNGQKCGLKTQKC